MRCAYVHPGTRRAAKRERRIDRREAGRHDWANRKVRETPAVVTVVERPFGIEGALYYSTYRECVLSVPARGRQQGPQWWRRR